MASSFTRFLDHTQRRTTFGMTPLDSWSALRRDLYLTTHNTHNRQTSMPPVGFEPTVSACERPQTYALDRAATGTGKKRGYLMWNMRFSWGLWISAVLKFKAVFLTPSLRANTWICPNDDDGAAGSLQFLHKSTRRHISQKHESKKGEVFPVYAIQVYIGSRGTNPLIRNLGTRWTWMVSFKPLSF